MTEFPDGVWTDVESLSLDELEEFLLTVEKWAPDQVAAHMALLREQEAPSEGPPSSG